ncbi:hypothetical protein B0A48_04723 [Cryoendolithus antarcticus]|uniref:Zn(2)-C6 fungal-type domain-containing protein n=1 Tax=Cryoendolithus antarcticus TaxID=1507870 RepID=A0A1V8TD78_9PEZI|nr:hypothetical protein B0A48_04723 [Cryoendolithus antarcticus]
MAYSQSQGTPSTMASQTVTPPNSEPHGQKRKTPPHQTGTKPSKKVKRVGPKNDAPKPDSMATGDGDNDGDGNKAKRVRTGCLTCRERHLKCDEAWPSCQNCRKSNRQCKRGIKLNFIDTWCDQPPHIVTLFGTHDWRVEFLDESREIATEYVGGTHVYEPLQQPVPRAHTRERPREDSTILHYAPSGPPSGPVPQHTYPPNDTFAHDPSLMQQPNLPHSNGMLYNELPRSEPMQYPMHPPSTVSSNLSGQQATIPHTNPEQVPAHHHAPNGTEVSSVHEKREFLNTSEETLFMQVFVEEVGLWMDSMDALKHFSRLLPFHSLSEPMLLNAFLACGARHLTLVNPAYSEEKALHYYDTATTYLLKNLQDPNRDTVICATTAVILNVYEVMSERALQRMNHIAGARALIKECGWNARATGIGAACFWLNVGLEVLSCLHFNWQVAWDPDDWFIDMDLSREMHNGREEVWTHRMLYIVAKVCNFRATVPRNADKNSRDNQIRTQQRYEEWMRLKGMADAWNENIPRTMHPMAYVFGYQTSNKSCFPEVWLIKRTSIVARLFYHTAMLLLAQVNPYMSVEAGGEMTDLQNRHAQMICGITAHVKDRGVASVAIRSLAHAGEVIKDRREQEEILTIFEKINKETGWRIGFVYKELKERWGWQEEVSPMQWNQTHTAVRQQKEAEEARQQLQADLQQQQAQAAQQQQQQQGMQNMQLQQNFDFSAHSTPNSTISHQQQPMHQPQPHLLPPPANPQHHQRTSTSSSTSSGSSAPGSGKKPPSGILNPIYKTADFTLPQHPYQKYYVAPSAGHGQAQGGLWWGN